MMGKWENYQHLHTYRYETIQFKSQLSSFEGDQVDQVYPWLTWWQLKLKWSLDSKYQACNNDE